jgi:outer membrane protein assembly factor BamB
MHQFDAAQDGFNAFDHSLPMDNVPSLRLRATINLATPYTADAPVISDGMMFVAGYGLQQTEVLYAFSEDCAIEVRNCQPLWTADVGYNAQPRVAAGAGMVFVGSDQPTSSNPLARLWAFPIHCALVAGVCSPAWTYDFPTGYPIIASPTILGSQLFVSAGFSPSYGGAFLYAFDTQCSVEHTPCVPTWKGALSVASLGSPAVAGGIVYVTDYGDLRAFRVDCGAGGATCPPLWTAGVGIVGPPTVADGEVFVTGGGFVLAFPALCSRSPCSPLWHGGGASDGSSAVAVADGLVYMVSNDGRLFALPAICHVGSDQLCDPAWTAELRDGHVYSRFTTPAVVNGVVFVTWTSYTKVFIEAFPARCQMGQGNGCPPLWKASVGYYELEGPAVDGPNLFLGGGPFAGPGQVFVFSPSGQ